MNDLSTLTTLLARLDRVAPPMEIDATLTALSSAEDYELGYDLARPLLPFQRAGVAYALRQRRVLIGDEAGLGKTSQAIAVAVKAHEEGLRTLIVPPPFLTPNWVREFKVSAPHLTVSVLTGQKNTPVPNTDVVIIGDSVVAHWAETLADIGFGCLVVDESHRIKNPKAKRTKALLAIGTTIPKNGYIILLSGTAIVNRPVEIVPQLELLGTLKTVFGSASKFKMRYCAPVHNGFGMTFNGAENTAELNEKLKGTCYVRRRKMDVLTELPAKRLAQVAVELSKYQLSAYERAEQNFMSFVFDKGGREAVLRASRAEVITRLNSLLALIGEAKIDAVVEQAETLLENDEKVVIFAWHRKVIEALTERLSQDHKVVVVAGGSSAEQKQSAVDAFQNDESTCVFIGQFESAGVGLTLTASSNVIVAQLPWSPSLLSQAIDRCHRIGQHDSVTAWLVTGARTAGDALIDERLYAVLNAKSEVVSSVLDGYAEDLGAEDGSVVATLLADWFG